MHLYLLLFWIDRYSSYFIYVTHCTIYDLNRLILSDLNPAVFDLRAMTYSCGSPISFRYAQTYRQTTCSYMHIGRRTNRLRQGNMVRSGGSQT
jgi:hypothetical protein